MIFFTVLNECLKMFHNPLPNPEINFQNLNGDKTFSKFDIFDVYLLIRVDDGYSKCLEINSHKGLY